MDQCFTLYQLCSSAELPSPNFVKAKQPPDMFVGIKRDEIVPKMGDTCYGAQTQLPPLQNHAIGPIGPQGDRCTLTSALASKERYHLTLDAIMSPVHLDMQPVAYLNKGQWYHLGMAMSPSILTNLGPTHVRSVVTIAMLEEKDSKVQQSLWDFCITQQTSSSAVNALEIDQRGSAQGFGLQYVAHNAVAVDWNAFTGAQVRLRLNFLSTDFSAQKGVKGFPLCLQVDCYEDGVEDDSEPAYRAFCQVKTFKDKGAERKARDELRRFDNVPGANPSIQSSLTKTLLGSVICLRPMSLDSPKPYLHNRTVMVVQPLVRSLQNLYTSQLTSSEPPRKKTSFASYEASPQEPWLQSRATPALVIYIRREREVVFRMLALAELTASALKHMVAEKLDLNPSCVTTLLKKTERGILVSMEDRLVEMIRNEDAFQVTVQEDTFLPSGDLAVIMSAV